MTRPLLLERMNTPPRTPPKIRPPFPLVAAKVHESVVTIVSLLMICLVAMLVVIAIPFNEKRMPFPETVKHGDWRIENLEVAKPVVHKTWTTQKHGRKR